MPAERVIPLPVDTAVVIDGVSVTLMDANHCPGACMMLFKVPTKSGKPEVLTVSGFALTGSRKKKQTPQMALC